MLKKVVAHEQSNGTSKVPSLIQQIKKILLDAGISATSKAVKKLDSISTQYSQGNYTKALALANGFKIQFPAGDYDDTAEEVQELIENLQELLSDAIDL